MKDHRPATEDETQAWLAGHLSITGAVETDHGLMIPLDVDEREDYCSDCNDAPCRCE